jgi:L-malate glycosyltransferase
MSQLLKIGIVCYPTIGGSGIVATQLGLLLAEAGHEIHFISYERPVRLGKELPNLFFHPVIVNEYPLFKYGDYTLPLSVRISEVSQQYGLDVLHVHYAVPHATAALLARLMLGSQQKQQPVIVTTLHGTDTNLLGNDPHYRPIIKYSIENSCGVTTVSESLKQQTIETFSITHPIEVIPNFFEKTPPTSTREAVRKELGIAEDEYLLLHMSNLRPGKRVEDILEAFAALKNRKRTKLLILAGSTFAPYATMLDTLEINQSVIILENIHAIEDYITASDIGVYASEQESFGLSILETLAYGKPVVATSVGGIPEVVSHGQTGLLLPPRQPKALAEAIDQLIDDPEYREKLGTAAEQDTATRFNAPSISKQYLKFYYNLMQTKRPKNQKPDKSLPGNAEPQLGTIAPEGFQPQEGTKSTDTSSPKKNPS